MIELKAAIESAVTFAKEYMTIDLKDLALEEVATDATGGDWLITLGYTLPHTRYRERGSSMEYLAPVGPRIVEYPREYKQFTVDGQTGSVKAMKVVSI